MKFVFIYKAFFRNLKFPKGNVPTLLQLIYILDVMVSVLNFSNFSQYFTKVTVSVCVTLKKGQMETKANSQLTILEVY